MPDIVEPMRQDDIAQRPPSLPLPPPKPNIEKRKEKIVGEGGGETKLPPIVTVEWRMAVFGVPPSLVVQQECVETAIHTSACKENAVKGEWAKK